MNFRYTANKIFSTSVSMQYLLHADTKELFFVYLQCKSNQHPVLYLATPSEVSGPVTECSWLPFIVPPPPPSLFDRGQSISFPEILYFSSQNQLRFSPLYPKPSVRVYGDSLGYYSTGGTPPQPRPPGPPCSKHRLSGGPVPGTLAESAHVISTASP